MSTLTLQDNRSLQSGLIMLLTWGVLMLSLQAGEGLVGVILATMADAYIQVTSFVAATLFVFYGLEKLAGINAEKAISEASPSRQVILAAFLGALPGCGGAIIVITQYVTGRLSFGAVLAALTATMGDAAFLLIAQEPLTGAAILMLGFSVGSVTGIIANMLHGVDFMRPEKQQAEYTTEEPRYGPGGWLNQIWMLLFLPGLVLGILAAFQVDIDGLIGTATWPAPSLTIGAVGGFLCVAMFLAPKIFGASRSSGATTAFGQKTTRVINDTNFVTSWVVLAFLCFELSVYVFDLDLAEAFQGWRIFTPMIAVLIGFLPGCGPQVLVTSLYLTGAIPVSALIGNAISNDGDALFPAIAIAPKAAIVATLYSAIPALILGYGWMLLVEGI